MFTLLSFLNPLVIVCRDDGTFSPGAIVTIDGPSRIESWLGEGDSSIPIIEVVGKSMMIVDKVASNIMTLPEVTILAPSQRMQAFHIPNVQLKLDALNLVDSNCRGLLCDSLECFQQGSISSQCSCFSAVSRLGRAVALVSFRVLSNPMDESQSKELFVVDHFTSKSFTNLLCSNNTMPIEVSSRNLERRAHKLFFRSAKNLIDQVNQKSGWALTGWTRRGYSRDVNASATQGGSSSTTNQVVSSNLIYHPTFIIPNRDADGDEVDISDFQFSFNAVME